MEPLQWSNTISERFSQLTFNLGVVPLRFIRTTDSDHITAVQHLWRRLKDRKAIYQGKHAGWYSVSDETFYSEHELTSSVDGETDGSRKIAKGSGKVVEWVEEPNYMFRLSEYRGRVSEWINSGNVFPPSRANDLREYVDDNKGYFTDISVSRRSSIVKWGIPVPEDPSQMIYVWLDALTNYLTVTGYPEKIHNADVHIIGKDILKFHSVYWPAFLMAADLPPPKKIIVHGHWTVNGTKMSKSLGNSIDPAECITKLGVDPFRYFLLRNSRLESDADFSFSSAIKNINSELVNQLGNLFSRTFTIKFMESFDRTTEPFYPTSGISEMVLQVCNQAANHFDRYDFGAGLERLQVILQEANRRFNEAQPWNKIKEGNIEPVRHLLVDVAFCIFAFSVMTRPIIPSTSNMVLDMFQIPQAFRYFNSISQFQFNFRAILDGVGGGSLLGRRQQHLFPRLIE